MEANVREMSQYGVPILDFNPEKDRLYAAFDEYFDRPKMAKVFDRTAYSVYMTKTHCLLSNECRYLIAFVIRDSMPVGYVQELKNLLWVCFETRTMTDKHDLPPHGYQVKRKGILESSIKRIKTTPEYSTYECKDFPINVTLLGDGKGGALYQDNGNLILALETFSTVITFNTDL